MGGRVENDLRPIDNKKLAQTLPVPDRGNLHHQIQAFSVKIGKLLLDIVGVVLVDIHDDQPLGVMLDDLAAQLGADGPAAPRYQDGLPT